ncbi:CYCLIN D7, partial [Prunus dulcis]
GLEYWMVDLLSVACLSIAIKFNDTCTPTLLEIQHNPKNGNDAAKGIRMAPCFYNILFLPRLLIRIMDSLKPQLHQEFIARVNKLLLGAISVWTSYKLQQQTSDACLTCLTSLLDHDRKAELVKCHKIMEEQSVDGLDNLMGHEIFHFCPSSPKQCC